MTERSTKPRSHGATKPRSARRAPAESIITPHAYQRAFLDDAARYILLLWSRQTGKSFSVALKVNIDIVEVEARQQRTLWTVVAATKPRARELALKIRDVGRAVCAVRKILQGPNLADLGESQYELTYPGGSRVVVAAAGSAAGFTGNLVFDEFDLVKQQETVWGDAFPVASRGDYKVYVMTTPRGRRMAYTLHQDSQRDDGIWSVHRLTIHEAVAQGCPQDPETLRRAIKSERLWRQEYLCEFVESSTVWLSWDLITRCTDPRATVAVRDSDNPVAFGWDVARWHDLSVLWCAEQVGRAWITCGIVVMRGLPFPQQYDLVERTVRQFPQRRRLCIDAGGMGEPVVDEMERRLGRYFVEGIKFTADNKAALAGELRHGMEDLLWLIPDDEEVYADLNCVQQTQTPAGNVRFEGESGDSHADRFWAAALCRRAGATTERPVLWFPGCDAAAQA